MSQTIFPKPGTLWVTFEEDGHQFMVGAMKEFAKAHDDPGFVMTDFGQEYSVRVENSDNVILHHNCSTDNVKFSPNYTGTIEIDGKRLTVKQLAILLSEV